MINASKLTWRSTAAAVSLAGLETRQAWDRLNARGLDLPFLDSSVVLGALQVFGSGGEQLWTGSDGADVKAMFVLARQGALRWQTFQPSQLPLGSWVADAGLDIGELCGALMSAMGPVLALTLTQVDPLAATRPADSGTSETADYIDTGWVEIAGTFEDYWAARGKNLRQNMRKQRNRLTADSVQASMHVLRDPTEMAGAIERYGALESQGWKSDQGTAIHPSNAQGRFYRGLLEQAATRGEALVYEYRFDGRTVAMNLCIRRQRCLVVLKTTYDESIKTLSPAFLLREEELQSWFRSGEFDRIEYYGKLMDWHTKLTDRKRTIYHLTRYRFGWLKSLAAGRRRRRLPAEQSAAPAGPTETATT